MALTSDSIKSALEQITLPDGVNATAITIGQGWWAVVTDDQRVLIYDQVRPGNLYPK